MLGIYRSIRKLAKIFCLSHKEISISVFSGIDLLMVLLRLYRKLFLADIQVAHRRGKPNLFESIRNPLYFYLLKFQPQIFVFCF